MALTIGANSDSLRARRHLSTVTSQLATSFRRVASGLRIESARDDAAGLGISERMRARFRSLDASARNIQDGIGLLRTAESVTGDLQSLLIRMRELAVRNYNATLATSDHEAHQAEYAQLVDEYARLVGSTSFNGIELFTKKQRIALQVGAEEGETITIKLKNYTAHAKLLRSQTLLTASGTEAIQKIVDIGIDYLSRERGKLGATENRLRSGLRSVTRASENLRASESRIRDVDIAHESANIARAMVLQSAGVSVLVQANLQPALALLLLRTSSSGDESDALPSPFVRFQPHDASS